MSPTVVCSSEYQDDIGTTEILQSVDKRAVGVVLTVVSCEAHRRTGERVVLVEAPSFLGYQLVLPSLLHCGHVSILMLSVKIPHGVGVAREIILECTI